MKINKRLFVKSISNPKTLLVVFVCVLGLIVVGSAYWLMRQRIQLSSQASGGNGERYFDPIFSDLTVTKNLTYSVIGQDALQLDLYQPKNDGLSRRPAIIWIHAGGFYSGNRESMTGLAQAFAKRGYVTATISYRLIGEPGMEEQIKDIRKIKDFPAVMAAQSDAQTAIRWFRANADVYRIDSDQVYIAGGSAGAITALMAGYNSEQPPVNREYANQSVKVAGIVAIMGIADPALIQPGEPPVIMFNAGLDNLIKPDWVKVFQKEIEKANIVHEFYFYPNKPHGMPPNGDGIMKSAEFLAKLVTAKAGVTPTPSIVVSSAPTSKPTPIIKPSLSPTPTSRPTSIPKLDILEYFEKNKAVACSYLKTYFDNQHIKPAEFTNQRLADLVASEQVVALVVQQTGATALSISRAYLLVCR